MYVFRKKSKVGEDEALALLRCEALENLHIKISKRRKAIMKVSEP